MTLRVFYDKEFNWIVFEGETKGWIYRQVMLPTMLEHATTPPVS